MDIEIKKLTPLLLDDYLFFFDNIAFADHQEWSFCYCCYFHLDEQLETECEKLPEKEWGRFSRDAASRLIKDGKLQGYLAYSGGKVAGWCNANDKTAYTRLTREKWPDIWEDGETGQGIKSVVCFTIAPKLRGQGVSSKLLKRVCIDANSGGYSVVEAYPRKNTSDAYDNFPGPLSLYENQGFSFVKDAGDKVVMRKYLL